jgi:hypothetical protein
MNLHKFVIEVNCLTNFFNNEETKQKISQRNLQSNKIPPSRKNAIVFIQTREKLSITNKGKPWTEARRLAQNKRGNK